MRRKVYTILISSLMLSLLLTIQLNTMCVQATEAEGFESNITNDTLSQGNPAIYGNRVVWTEYTLDSGNWEIFLYDLSIDAKIQITHNASNQFNPEIYGDTIVWEDKRHGNYDIYMYDLAEDSDGDGDPNYLDDDRPYPDPAEIRITDNPAHQEKPAIYGTKIVWEDLRDGNRDVYIYDMISGKEAIIAGLGETRVPNPLDPKDLIYPWWQINPRIYGDKVVWQNFSYLDFQNKGIYMYNLSTDSDGDGVPNYLDDDRPCPDPAEEKISSNSKPDLSPSIYDDFIVYIRSNNIYLYNIATKMEYKLTNSTSGQKIDAEFCNVYGTKVVWAYDVGTKDIYLYNLSMDSDNDGEPNYRDTDTPHPDPALVRVTNESEEESMLPAIYTNKIVWQDSRNPSIDIYLFTLTDNLPPEITHRMPNYTSEIMEGESLVFNIISSDPEGDDLNLTYTWFLDEAKLPGEDTDQYEFISDYDSAGVHEVKVVVSDGEYPVEEVWLIYVAESGIVPLKITQLDPVMSPTIIEGEEITLSMRAKYLGSKTLSIQWDWDEDLIPEPQTSNHTSNGEVYAELLFESQLDSNGSDYNERYDITVRVTDGTHTTSHKWLLTVLYFKDADMDGYNDSIEVAWYSEPLNRSSTPIDKDSDFIVDADDDDKDGDGFLDEYDAYPLDPNKQLSGKPDYSVEILIIIIILILVIATIATMSGVSKSGSR